MNSRGGQPVVTISTFLAASRADQEEMARRVEIPPCPEHEEIRACDACSARAVWEGYQRKRRREEERRGRYRLAEGGPQQLPSVRTCAGGGEKLPWGTFVFVRGQRIYCPDHDPDPEAQGWLGASSPEDEDDIPKGFRR